jgi:hypothetical protein
VLAGQNMGTASSLIGKRISALSDEKENINGVVDRVSVEVDAEKNGERTFKLHVNAIDDEGQEAQHVVDLKNVREVFGDAA